LRPLRRRHELRGNGIAQAVLEDRVDALIEHPAIEPFKLRVPSGQGYYLVAPGEMLQGRGVAAFHRWLRKEISSGAKT
jgi:hypothetical protein